MKSVTAHAFALLSLIVGGIAAGFPKSAQATLREPLQCGLTFNAQGGGLHVIIGYFELNGPGHVRCTDDAGNVSDLPVWVTIGGDPISLGIGAGQLSVRGSATGLGIVRSTRALIGTYVVAGGQVAVVGGVGATVGFQARGESVNLDVSMQTVRGIGFDVGISRLRIETRGRNHLE